MKTYNLKPKSSLEFRVPHNLRTNSLANANIPVFILYAILVVLAMMIEMATYKLVLLEVMQFNIEEAEEARFLVLLFSKLIALALYKPFIAWLKSSSKWFYKVVLRTVAITVIANVIIFGILYSYQNMLDLAIENKERVSKTITARQQLLVDVDDPNLQNSIQNDIKDLELKKARYDARIISIEDSALLRTLKVLFSVLLGFNSVVISAIIFLWCYLYFLALLYKFKIKRLRKRLDIVRGTFYTRLDHLDLTHIKMLDLEAKVLELIKSAK